MSSGVDRTSWPAQDSEGNNLRHSEVCAWRFGGVCDCVRPEGAEPSTTTPLTRETVSGQNRPAPDGDSEPLFACASPIQHCGEEEPHGPHEWLVSMRRTQCPGTPVDESSKTPSLCPNCGNTLASHDAFNPPRCPVVLFDPNWQGADVSPLPNPVSPPGTPTTGDEANSAKIAEVRAPLETLMGDDGTGHCKGCGGSIEQFDPDCDVCMVALDAISGRGPERKADEMHARAVAALGRASERGQIVANVGQPPGWWHLITESELARIEDALSQVVGLSADVTRLEAELEGVHLALAEGNVERAAGDDEPLWSEQYRVRLLYGQRDAAEVRVKELEQQVSGLASALGDDAAGRPFGELLIAAADLLDSAGGGPLADCLRLKADAVDVARSALARLAEALPSSSVVPVEAGTGEANSTESVEIRGKGSA